MMAIAPRLDQRLSHSLVMTPQLQQAIKLLQFNNQELSEFINEELRDNPLLERPENVASGNDAEGSPETQTEHGTEKSAESGDPEVMDFEHQTSVEIPDAVGLDVDYDNHYNNDGGSDVHVPDLNSQINTQANNPENTPTSTLENSMAGQSTTSFAEPGNSGQNNQAGSSGGSSGSVIEQTISDTISLRDHLHSQVQIDITDPIDRLIASHLIELVDETGYIPADFGDLVESLGCTDDHIEQVLSQVQEFDPPGIFARDLGECLALQLKDKDRFDPAMELFVGNLDLVASRRYSELSKICGVDHEDIADMVDEIRMLDPKPALAFDHTTAQPIIPDVLMRPGPGGWIIELNPASLPRVLVNQQYLARVTQDVRHKEEKRYISDQLQSANWLVKALDQRATTILRVSTELVRLQDSFFKHGVQYLKPLVLRDIAEIIEMHESTVSRVTSNKYIATPRGIYELKYFFTSSINSTGGGEAISAESVRHQIKSIINEESPKKILSDDKLVILLKKEGIDIARRTVAKYREAMKIPSSVQRRREKAIPK